MPGFSLPPPPPGLGSDTMACSRMLQYEIQMRDQHIRQLDLENVRLKVKLEQAEMDAKTVVDVMMIAFRSQGMERNLITPTEIIRGQRSEEQSEATGEFRNWTLSNSRAEGRPRGDPLPNPSQQVEESLLDLDHNDGNHRRCGPPARRSVEEGWRVPPTLTLQSPFTTPAKVADSGSCISITKEKSKISGATAGLRRPDNGRFKHLFVLAEDDDKSDSPPQKYDEDVARRAEQATEAMVRYTAAGCISTSLEGRPHGLRRVTDVGPEPKRKPSESKWSAGVFHPTDDGNSQDRTRSQPTESSGSNHVCQESSDSDQAFFNNVPRGPRADRCKVGRNSYRQIARRYIEQDGTNDSKPREPQNVDELLYKPEPNSKNAYRTVIICNLPPQTDIAEIVARVGDALILSIKLLPTKGMKGKKCDGSVGVLRTLTAMVTFFQASSAEQFIFDIQEQPLLIRDCVAITLLLKTPTFPSRCEVGAYERAPGRLFSRRIKFQRPSLVRAHEFDDVLARHSYGYQTKGWILNKTRKQEQGRDMITVEFASIETARWAYNRICSNENFEGCFPKWVYDHEDGAGGDNRQCLLKTQDEEDSSGAETDGSHDVWGTRLAPTGHALGASTYAREGQSVHRG